MDETQNDMSPEAGGDAGAGKSGAKLIRGGNGADAGSKPGGEAAEAQAAAAASAAAGVILTAGRRAAAGVHEVRRQAEDGAEALGREAMQQARAAEEVAAGVGGTMVGEWMSYAQRAYIRNAKALGELLYCRTPLGLVRWQSNLLGETLSDLKDTNSRILRLASNKA
jgi:hypothetical protein